jgi:ATP-dependent DNA helicase RecG
LADAAPATKGPRSLQDLGGVGPELARKLAALDIRTPADLARTYPRAYRDWRTAPPIAEIVRRVLAHAGDDAQTLEEIAVADVVSVREVRRRIAVVSAELADGSGTMRATWFGRRGFTGKLVPGDRVFVHGRVALKRGRGALGAEMNVLHHRILAPGERYAGEVVPVYPAGKELSSRAIATIMQRNLEALAAFVPDALPPEVRARHGLGSAVDAWREMHKPETPEAAERAHERLMFDEFFYVALAAALRRAERAAAGGAAALLEGTDVLAAFAATLPFALTGAQRRCIGQIFADMARSAPMNRLLQGDVGSGKTLVAAAAVALAARGGVQSALMAPTEILATQHARKLAPLLLSLGVRVDVVMGSQGARARAEARGRLASGECDLAIGTHALLTENVEFRRLGLAVIDEQHRFGVMQRARLRSKGGAVHTLHMTATPIPRSLAQTKYADLDVSLLDELPPGRTKIATYVLRDGLKPRAYDFVRAQVQRGRQAFVVAPAIDEADDDALESDAALTSALAEFARLREEVFPDLKVALLHGRMPGREKDATMDAFARGEFDVLLATTVVEVGVDVANATVMVVLDAHRYGLAQLHQLRGRVGRGAAESYCLLVAPDDFAFIERLDILAHTNDGFEIAEADLRLREAGEFAGTAQAGRGDGLLGDVQRHFKMYMQAKADADAVVAADPALLLPEHARLLALVEGERAQRAALVSS